MKPGPVQVWKKMPLSHLPAHVRKDRLCEEAWKHTDGWVLVRWGGRIEEHVSSDGTVVTRERIVSTWFLSTNGCPADAIARLDSTLKRRAFLRPPTVWANEIIQKQSSTEV